MLTGHSVDFCALNFKIWLLWLGLQINGILSWTLDVLIKYAEKQSEVKNALCRVIIAAADHLGTQGTGASALLT